MEWLCQIVAELAIKTGVEKMKELINKRMRPKVRNRVIVQVIEHGHFVREADAEKNISFGVLFTKTWPMVITITKVEYEVLYDYKVVQHKSCECKHTMSRSDNQTRIALLYNPMESRLGLPPSSDKWQIRGKATLESVYGITVLDFSSTRNLTVTHDTDWHVLRGEINALS